MRVRELEGGCEYEGCTNKADHVVYDREEEVVKCLCSIHEYEVADSQAPEYIVDCPNCGCKFGVN